MAEYALQGAFSAGEIAPALWGQVTLAKYHAAATTMRNGFCNYRGGYYSRAGTAMCLRSKQAYPNPPRVITFQFSINNGYCLEFGDYYMRVFTNGAPVVDISATITGITNANPGVVAATNSFSNGDWVTLEEVAGMTQVNGYTYIVASASSSHFTLTDLDGNDVDTTGFGTYTSGGTASRIFTLVTPWAVTDLPLLKFTQSADVMSLCNPNYPPYDLGRISATDWSLTESTFGAVIAAPASCTATATTQPSQATSPPTLPAAYAYVVTAVDAKTGQESVASPVGNVTNSVDIASTAGSIIINWAPVSGAGTYNIYKAPTSYNTQPGNTSEALPVPAGALFGYAGTSYGTQFVDSNITPDLTQVPPVHTNPFAPGQILELPILTPGSGLVSVGITINTSTGSGFIGQPVIVNGQLLAVIIQNAGLDYAQTDTVTYTGTSGGFASGTETFVSNPSVGDTITLNGVEFYFETNLSAPNQLPIKSTLALTLDAAVPILNASAYGAVSVASYTNTATVLTITYNTAGIGGNTYTLAASVATPSGGTLTGGSSSGGSATAPTGSVTVGPETGTYPGCVAYYQQRRVYASSSNDPDTYWMSQPGSFLDFDTSIPVTDADAITGTPWAQQVNGIQFMVPMPGGLVTLTGLGAWQVTGSGGSAINPVAITPSSQQAQPQAFNGCSAQLGPVTVDYDILYVQSKGSIVLDLAYNYWINIYTGSDLTELSGQLFANYTLVQWAWCREPYKVVWAVRNDGAMLSLTYVKQQEVYGWARHDTLGQFVSVCAVTELPVDALYLVTGRPTNAQGGDPVYYIERMDNRIWTGTEDPWCVDCALSYAMPEPDATLTITYAGPTAPATFTASAGVFSAANVGQVIRAAGGIAVVTEYTNDEAVQGTWCLPPTQFVPNDPNGNLVPAAPGAWTMTAPIQTVTGLLHLAGLYVTGLADGVPITPQIVSATGSIILQYPASDIKIGLGFTAQMQTPRLETQGQETIQTRRKTVTAITGRIEASAMLQYGTNQPDGAAQVPPVIAPPWTNLTQVVDQGATYTSPGGATVTTLWTGDLREPVLPNWAKPGQLAIQQVNPIPMQINAVVPEFLEGDLPEITYAQAQERPPQQPPRGPGRWMLG